MNKLISFIFVKNNDDFLMSVPKQAPKIEFEEPEETYDDIDIPENNSQLSVPSSKEDSISLNDDMYGKNGVIHQT